jgi:hypothetical protein
MRLHAIVLALLFVLPATARAQDGCGSLDVTAVAHEAALPKLVWAQQLALFAPAPDAATPPRLQAKIKLARRLMPWHRALGLVTLAMLLASNILGSLDYYDKYDARGTDTGQFTGWHEGLSIGATAAFAATGALALAAPNPQRRPLKLDATLVHKLALALAAVGFVAELVLGPISSASDGKLFQRDLAVSHLVIGWTTLGFTSAGVLSFVF